MKIAAIEQNANELALAFEQEQVDGDLDDMNDNFE
jgi:hypothetical protein